MSPQLRVSGSKAGENVELSDALQDEAFLSLLLEAIRTGPRLSKARAANFALRTRVRFRRRKAETQASLRPRAIKAEQSNSSIAYGERLMLKFVRRLEEGISPDLEVGAFLTEKAHYQHTPQLSGALEYRSSSGQCMTQGILQAFVRNEGDAWQYTMKSISSFYNQMADVAIAGELTASQEEFGAFFRGSVSGIRCAAGAANRGTASGAGLRKRRARSGFCSRTVRR